MDVLRLSAGMSASETSRALFLPLTLTIPLCEFVMGQFVDRLDPSKLVRTLAMNYALIGVTGCCSLLVSTRLSVVIFGCFYGCFVGASFCLQTLVMPNLYGTHAIGKVQSICTAVNVINAGLGPLLFGVCRDLTGQYTTVISACAGTCISIAVAVALTPVKSWQQLVEAHPE